MDVILSLKENKLNNFIFLNQAWIAPVHIIQFYPLRRWEGLKEKITVTFMIVVQDVKAVKTLICSV